MTTSINTNISAYYSQNNLRASSADAQSSIARLSSGNKIIRAADDVAGLSIGTILRTDVNTLRTALNNTSQASSLIQVADGAIERLGEILQRQKALAVQGNADTLSDTERGYLDQEFQELTNEYDRIVARTEFNGTGLLNGNLTGSAVLAASASTGTVATSNFTLTTDSTTNISAISVSSLGTSATTGGQAFDANFTAANISSATVTATPGTTVIGDFVTSKYINSLTSVDIDDLGKVEALNDFLNNISTVAVSFANSDAADDQYGELTIAAGGVTFTHTLPRDYSNNPGPVVLTDATSGAEIRVDLNILGDGVDTNAELATAAAAIQVELRASTYATTAANSDFTLASGDALITTATVGALGTGQTAIDRLASITNFLDNIGSAVVTATADGGNDDGTGSISVVSGTETYTSGDITLTGSPPADFVLTNAATGATITIDPADLSITNAATFTSVTEGTFEAALQSITATVVPNASDFSLTPVVDTVAVSSLGTNTTTGETNIKAFFADFANLQAYFLDDSANNDGSGTLTLQAGGQTFVNTSDVSFTGNPAAVVLTSTGGNGETITVNLNDLNLVSDDTLGLLDASGRVEDALRALRAADNSQDGTGVISITIGDMVFDSPSATDFNGDPTAILFTNSGTGAQGEVLSIDLASHTVTSDTNLTSLAALLQTDIRGTLANPGLNYTNTFVFADTEATTGAAAFQVGISSLDTITVDIGNLDAASVGTSTLSVATKAGSIAASDAIDTAINTVTSARASVGAIQSRFDFAAANLEVSIQNLDAARAGLLDADISEESTAFAQNQVLIQASISVLAQANQLPQNLLKLIG